MYFSASSSLVHLFDLRGDAGGRLLSSTLLLQPQHFLCSSLNCVYVSFSVVLVTRRNIQGHQQSAEWLPWQQLVHRAGLGLHPEDGESVSCSFSFHAEKRLNETDNHKLVFLTVKIKILDVKFCQNLDLRKFQLLIAVVFVLLFCY